MITMEQLEELLEGATETQRVDFKESCQWDVKKFAKDILAMSNLKDGGYIVIGVKELKHSFRREGISSRDKNSYSVDEMKDQMSAYADPNVEFSVDFPFDKNKMQYCVITVNEFKETPVICKKDCKEIKAGAIYYRNSNRRIESSVVSNSYDMRDIVKLATRKMMQRKIEFGYTVDKSAKNKLDEELGDL